jgi:hypothetical protein
MNGGIVSRTGEERIKLARVMGNRCSTTVDSQIELLPHFSPSDCFLYHMRSLEDFVSLALTKTIRTLMWSSTYPSRTDKKRNKAVLFRDLVSHLWLPNGDPLHPPRYSRPNLAGTSKMPRHKLLTHRVMMTSRLHKAPQQSPGRVRKMLDMAIASSFFRNSRSRRNGLVD